MILLVLSRSVFLSSTRIETLEASSLRRKKTVPSEEKTGVWSRGPRFLIGYSERVTLCCMVALVATVYHRYLRRGEQPEPRGNADVDALMSKKAAADLQFVKRRSFR